MRCLDERRGSDVTNVACVPAVPEWHAPLLKHITDQKVRGSVEKRD
jgi:hypothetical protein